MNDKFVSKKGELHLIENEDLDCKNCVFAYKDRTIDCIRFSQKPIDILDGSKCEKKAKSIEEARKMNL